MNYHNFENEYILGPKKLSENRSLITKIKDKIKKIFEGRPNEKNFTDIFDYNVIFDDISEIEAREKQFQNIDEENNYFEMISSGLEAVLVDQIAANEYFGKNCDSNPTSRYDDIKNGIDISCIFSSDENNEKTYLGLGVDVTLSSNSEITYKKIDSIKGCIRSGNLPYLKYFEDPETGEHKSMSLPKVIVGMSLKSTETLLELWGGNDPLKNKKLSEHPVQTIAILEILDQTRYFYEFAMNLSESSNNELLSGKYYEIAVAYGNMHNKFAEIHNEKIELISKHLNEASEDISLKEIKKHTS